MPSVSVVGADQLRLVGADLRRAGSRSRGVRSKLRRNLAAAAEPVKAKVKANVLAIPAKADSTGLRADIAQSIKVQVKTGGLNVVVRIWANPARMRTHPGSLAADMEGLGRPWRHPVYGGSTWVTQQSHPYMEPAESVAFVTAQAAAVAVINETALEIERGI